MPRRNTEGDVSPPGSPPDESSSPMSDSFRVRLPIRRNRRISFGESDVRNNIQSDPVISNERTRLRRSLFGSHGSILHSNNSYSDDDHDVFNEPSSGDHEHIRWSNDDNLNIIPRVLLNEKEPQLVSSTSFFRNHPEHCQRNNLTEMIEKFGLLYLMDNNLAIRKTERLDYNIDSEVRKTAGIKRKFEHLKSSFVQPGIRYSTAMPGDLQTDFKFTEVRNDGFIRGFIESGSVSLNFSGELIDFVNNDLRVKDGNKCIIERSVFNNLLRNILCFNDKDTRKFIGRHKRDKIGKGPWKPFYLDDLGYLKLNGYNLENTPKSKDTKFPNSSLLHKFESTCGNKCGAFKILAKWFDLPPFNEFINTPSPPTPPNGKRKHLNNPEDLLVCGDCQDSVMNTFILMKIEIDLEDLLEDPKDKTKDFRIKNDMEYKHRRRMKTFSNTTTPSRNSRNNTTNPTTPTSATRRYEVPHLSRSGFSMHGVPFVDSFLIPEEGGPPRTNVRLLDYLISRQSQRSASAEYAMFSYNDLGALRGDRSNPAISSDSDVNDEVSRLDHLHDYDFFQNYRDTNDDQDDDDDADDDEDDDDDDGNGDADELYEVELSSGRSRRIENLLYERNLSREQQHPRRGEVSAKKLYKNSSRMKMKLQLFVSVNRVTGELCMVSGNLDKNNWSSEENNGDLFEDYQTLLKLYEIFFCEDEIPVNKTETHSDDQAMQDSINKFKEYIENYKPNEKAKIQKLLLLILITSPYLSNSNKTKQAMAEIDESAVDLSEPQITENFSTAGRRLSRTRKNLQHEDDSDEKLDESEREEERFNEALIEYFNENINFNFDFNKVLRFKPSSSNNISQSKKLNKGGISCLDSLYSFSYC
ncbi:unnamed protein product [Ambrosiozyma monospora]|uniref:Unnamed protein product n=1 Tax=Ambrosiozyma monospora TaxID=43982 RepID=A0A9W6YUX8_AMBMO|nr:unnamed protein product [Ambrosiozyma monospora]